MFSVVIWELGCYPVSAFNVLCWRRTNIVCLQTHACKTANRVSVNIIYFWRSISFMGFFLFCSPMTFFFYSVFSSTWEFVNQFGQKISLQVSHTSLCLWHSWFGWWYHALLISFCCLFFFSFLQDTSAERGAPFCSLYCVVKWVFCEW